MNDNQTPLYGALFQAESHDQQQRVEWFLPSPAIAGKVHPRLTDCMVRGVAFNQGRFIKRRFDRPTHKPRWLCVESATGESAASKLMSQLEQYESMGWTILPPAVIALAEDDYLSLWQRTGFSTPYKALRQASAKYAKLQAASLRGEVLGLS